MKNLKVGDILIAITDTPYGWHKKVTKGELVVYSGKAYPWQLEESAIKLNGDNDTWFKPEWFKRKITSQKETVTARLP
jgi:hypothetical protein